MPRVDSQRFYLSSIKKYGQTPKGLHWISHETQELRFDILLSLLPDSIVSLADAGCGFGDFYHYIQKTQTKLQRYIGIDSLEKMCTIARKNTSQEIIHADITKERLPYAEYYICSGSMNLLSSFETHLFISNCFSYSQKGFIFNILHGHKVSPTYNYISTKQIENIASTLKARDLIIKDDYLKDDITVGLFV